MIEMSKAGVGHYSPLSGVLDVYYCTNYTRTSVNFTLYNTGNLLISIGMLNVHHGRELDTLTSLCFFPSTFLLLSSLKNNVHKSPSRRGRAQWRWGGWGGAWPAPCVCLALGAGVYGRITRQSHGTTRASVTRWQRCLHSLPWRGRTAVGQDSLCVSLLL